MRPRSHRSPRTATVRVRSLAGFTMIEVMLVLFLVGLSTALAVPRIDLDGYRVDAATSAIGTQLMTAQRLAIKRQHDVVVAFDTTAARIRVHEDADNDGEIDAGERVSHAGLGDGAVFGAGGAPTANLLGRAATVSYAGRQAGLPAVTFRRNGSASEEGGFVITSRRAAGGAGAPDRARGVRIERSTGRTTWYRYRGDAWSRES